MKPFYSIFGLAVCVGINFAHAAGNPTLKGRVIDADGKALPETTVLIYSAGPRVGANMMCPTCYPDCRKRAVTDADGKFSINDLNPHLLFRLLVVNKVSKPQFVPKTDPAKDAVEIKMEPRKSEFPRHQALRGFVSGPDGEPLHRAVAHFDFFSGQEANCGGQCDGVDLVSVTAEDGGFVLGSEKKFDTMTIAVEAPGFARRKFFQLHSEKIHQLKLTRGASVTGRLVKDGKPAPNVAVGIVSTDRSEYFTGNYDTFTDADGNFVFANIPPHQMYYVYSLMDQSLGDYALPARRVRVAADDSRRDLGDLELLKGVELRGRLKLSDGAAVPAGTELILGPNDAWDMRTIRVNSDGNFKTTGVPVGAYSLSARVPGYVCSDRNATLDRLNGGGIVGRIDHDLYVEILLEPGNQRRPNMGLAHQLGMDAIPYHKAMQGVVPDAN
jgi:hypothetical protein